MMLDTHKYFRFLLYNEFFIISKEFLYKYLILTITSKQLYYRSIYNLIKFKNLKFQNNITVIIFFLTIIVFCPKALCFIFINWEYYDKKYSIIFLNQ